MQCNRNIAIARYLVYWNLNWVNNQAILMMTLRTGEETDGYMKLKSGM